MRVGMTDKRMIEFSEEASLARFLSEVIRMGLTYEVHTINGGWRVLLTGGY